MIPKNNQSFQTPKRKISIGLGGEKLFFLRFHSEKRGNVNDIICKKESCSE